MINKFEVKNSSDYKQLLLNKFGNSSIVDETDPNGVEMVLEMNDYVEFRVSFVVLANLDTVKKGRLPKGRTQFRRAAENYLKLVWSEMAEKMKLNVMEPFKSRKLLVIQL